MSTVSTLRSDGRMEFCKSFSIGPVNVYVTTYRMRRRSGRDELYRRYRRQLGRIKRGLYDETRGRCQECGREFASGDLEIHHIVPVAERPELICSTSNMLLVCRECHDRLHVRRRE